MLEFSHIQFRHFVIILLLGLALLWSNPSVLGQDLNQIADQDAIKFSGSLGISTVFFETQGRNTNRKPFTWLFRGDPVLSIYGVDIPIYIMVSEQERNFRQPFNRVGFSPYYKWAKLHLGYQNLNFSKFSLAGHAMAGAGIEIDPGKWRVGYMRGRLLKAVQPNQLVEDSEFLAIPAYRRSGQALKIGYGTGQNFVDLVFLKASDDMESIDSIPMEYGLQPAANTIISLITKQQIFSGLTVDAEYAQSSYTNDLRTESADPPGLFKALPLIVNSTTSTEVSTALDASLHYQSKIWGMKIRLERISPNYRSMGAYFFLNDMQKITIEPSLKLLNNKINIFSSLGLQKNNLREQKSLQTNRTVGSVRITAHPFANYTLNINYANYGIAQKQGLIPLDEENYVSQVTENWGINQTYQVTTESTMHNALVNYQRQQLSDQNPNTADFSNYQNNTFFFNYSVNYLPLHLGININYTWSKFSTRALTTNYWGPNISLNAGLLKNRLRMSFGQSFLQNKSNDELQRKLNKTSFRASYKINRSQRISLRMHLNKSNTFVERINPFTENKIDLQYVYRFQ